MVWGFEDEIGTLRETHSFQNPKQDLVRHHMLKTNLFTEADFHSDVAKSQMSHMSEYYR